VKTLGIIVAIIAAMFLSAIWSGWVLTVLWGWFIVPLFGLPALSLVYAIGFSLVVRFLVFQIPNTTKNEDTSYKIYEAAAYSVVQPLVFLGVGFIVTLFM
jgi:hypothetical protein